MNPNYIKVLILPVFFISGFLSGKFWKTETNVRSGTNLPQLKTQTQTQSTSRYPKNLLAPHSRLLPSVVTGREQITDENGDLVYEDFVLNPFKITRSSKHHSWTSVNISGAKQIDQIVHNDFERERMMEEKDYFSEAQLVYRKITFQDLIEEHLAGGKAVESVILPGLDGAEYEVTINHWQAQPATAEERQGVFKGHLKDDPESEVSWAYYEGVESGNISSEKLNLHLSIDPREKGQVVVGAIDWEASQAAEEFISEGLLPDVQYDQQAVGDPSASFTRK